MQQTAPGKDSAQVGEEESFFADEPETNAVLASTMPIADEPADELDSWLDDAPAVQENDDTGKFEATVAEPVAVAPVKPCWEMVAEDSDETRLATDPALIEPLGVHVTAEPLLIDESPKEPARYGSSQQEIAPVYSFLSKVAERPAPEPAAVLEHSAGAVVSEARPASFEVPDSGLAFSSSELEERTPNCAPPDREALAEIPFLNPPASVAKPVPEKTGANGLPAGSLAVDAMVQKILEKLEPQLHEILSQHLLKPLIADLVQDEIEKKNR